jgi:hypothetical protein
MEGRFRSRSLCIDESEANTKSLADTMIPHCDNTAGDLGVNFLPHIST